MAVRHLIMGTSGHVDHGKTALIRMLTGIDTDRLKEEQDRGISIELGFAHLELPSGARLGIVDVPGHERFVKHMLAGAGGMDFVLLVVAADEGVMPQTVEHSQILALLGVERGLVALTKTDLVDPELIDLAEEDVRDYLSATPFLDWPIVRVSSTSGTGRDRLLEALDETVATVPERSSEGIARLPIDRVFVSQGFGTVVTGTLWQGAIRSGEQVAVLPAGRPARVRQVEVHGHKVAEATAGSRVALALHGVARDDLERGDWIAAPGALTGSSILDVRLRMVDTDERKLKQRERVRFHLGASEVYGRVTLFGCDELSRGEETVAQIRLERPVVAVRGDRFVLRWYSPVRTAGGGRVIDPGARKRRRSETGVVAALELLDSGSVRERVEAALAGRPRQGLTLEEVVSRSGATENEVRATMADLIEQGRVATLGRERWVSAAWRRRIEDELCEAANAYQTRYPLRFGLQLGELRSRFRDRLAPESVDAALAEMVAAGKARIQEDRVRAGGDAVALPPEQRQAADRFKRALEDAAFAVPALGEVIALLGTDNVAQELLVHLAGNGEIVRLTSDLCYTREQMEKLESMAIDHLRRNAGMTVAEFKDLVGVSRKYAVPLLERLDQRGITRRSGDRRVPGRLLTGSPTGRPVEQRQP